MTKICGIYKITSPTGKIYIGQSIDINRRFLKYKNLECKQQVKLYHSLLKYGWDLHKKEIICNCHKSKLNELEKQYINIYDTFNTNHGLNLSNGGHTTIFSQESINKIKKSKLGIKRPDNVRKKISEFKKNKPPHINCIHKPHNYSIFNQNNEIICNGKFNIKNKLRELNLPTYSFCKSYRNDIKILKGKYKDWYVIKVS